MCTIEYWYFQCLFRSDQRAAIELSTSKSTHDDHTSELEVNDGRIVTIENTNYSMTLTPKLQVTFAGTETPAEDAAGLRTDEHTATSESTTYYSMIPTPAENAAGLRTDKQTATSESTTYYSVIPTPRLETGNEEIATTENLAYHSVTRLQGGVGGNASEEFATTENLAYHSVMPTARLQDSTAENLTSSEMPTARLQGGAGASANEVIATTENAAYHSVISYTANCQACKAHQYMDSQPEGDNDYEN